MVFRKIAGFSTAVLFVSISSIAQTNSPSPTKSKADAKRGDTASTMTVVGCLVKEADYRSALERDPSFALAAARLAENRLQRHWFVAPLSPPKMEETKKMVDGALASAPDLAEAHIRARITYYHQVGYYTLAVHESRRTRRRLSPMYALVLTGSRHPR